MSICKACEHYKSSTRSCGTLGIGTTIGDVELCGCVMPIKTKLKIAYCPLGKWEALTSKEDIEEVKDFLSSLSENKISAYENNRLTELWNKASGNNRKVTNCKACVRDMIKQLKKYTNESE